MSHQREWPFLLHNIPHVDVFQHRGHLFQRPLASPAVKGQATGPGQALQSPGQQDHGLEGPDHHLRHRVLRLGHLHDRPNPGALLHEDQ